LAAAYCPCSWVWAPRYHYSCWPGGPASPVYAGTLTFPGACGGTIQACIDGASAGDTILISAGKYTASLTGAVRVTIILNLFKLDLPLVTP
jgi:hypothetical protein